MATVDKLVGTIARKVDDDSYTESIIIDFLNDGLLDIAKKVLLPYLESSAEISTVLGDSVVDKPDDYHKGLFKVNPVDGNKRPIRTVNSKGQMLRIFSRLDNVGDVTHVCVASGRLLYQPIPIEIQGFIISYYRVPDEIEDDPNNTALKALDAEHHKILIHYVCWQIFSEIEDGIDGAKVNTKYHEGRYNTLVEELDGELKEAQSLPDPPVVKSSFR